MSRCGGRPPSNYTNLRTVRIEPKRSVPDAVVVTTHLLTARQLATKSALPAVRIPCCQATRYQGKRKKALQTGMWSSCLMIAFMPCRLYGYYRSGVGLFSVRRTEVFKPAWPPDLTHGKTRLGELECTEGGSQFVAQNMKWLSRLDMIRVPGPRGRFA